MRIGLAALVAVVLSGCIGISYRVGAGPTVDTDGNVGGEVVAGITWGLAFTEGGALGFNHEGAVGVSSGPSPAAVLAYAQGMQLVWAADEDEFGVRLGLDIRVLAVDGETSLGLPAFRAAMLYGIHQSGYDFKNLGLELQIGGYVRDDEGPAFGRFRLSVMFDHHIIDDDGINLFGSKG